MSEIKPTRRPPQPKEIMKKEREYCPFDKRRMMAAMNGGEFNLSLKEKFMTELSRDPNFRLDDIHDLSKDEIRERTMAKFASMVHYVTTERLDIFTKRMELIGLADPAFWTRFGVHYGLFLGALRSGASPNQFSYWMEKGALGLNGLIGCFGMTELAHGSNVAGLETTATFDERTDEFIIHTPHISSTKWWIGGAAQTATHCAVFAQLIVNGKGYGTKTFIVPLRDTKSFDLLPGVTIGDIGKKQGRDGIDNGYILFTNVRIPRAYMLMKHTQVTRDGQVYEPPLAQLTYGALLQGRTAMVADAANVSKKALTIALRYAAVRRQFKTGDNEFETQILDYPLHQRRLLPLLSQAVAMGFTAQRLTALYEDLTQRLEGFDASSDEKETAEVLEKLKELHATSAGLKAFCTWEGLSTIDKCRQCCGGHGYSAYTGLASMYADQAVQCTWEGDNTILTLQAGRSLISSYQESRSGKNIASGVAYLKDSATYTDKCASDDKVTDLDTIDQAWSCAAANVVKKAAEDYQTLIKKGLSKDVALEQVSQQRFIAAKVHTFGYIFRTFREAIDVLAEQDEGVDKNNGVIDTLKVICRLFGLVQVEENAAVFLKYGFYSPKQMDIVTAAVSELCAELRKSAMSLVDSFCLSDHIINSPLGRHDGDVYVAYFNQVRAANPQKPHPYFDKIIKPLLHREPMDLSDHESMEIDDEIQELLEERKQESEAGVEERQEEHKQSEHVAEVPKGSKK